MQSTFKYLHHTHCRFYVLISILYIKKIGLKYMSFGLDFSLPILPFLKTILFTILSFNNIILNFNSKN